MEVKTCAKDKQQKGNGKRNDGNKWMEVKGEETVWGRMEGTRGE